MDNALQTTARVDVRPWPYEPHIVHLILRDVNMVPTSEQIDAWVADHLGRGLRHGDEINGSSGSPSPSTTVAIRTGALFPEAADAFARRGFVAVDRLALLERHLAPTERIPRPSSRDRRVVLRRLRTRDLDTAATIDVDAFPAGWQNDPRSLDDIRRATRRAHPRIAMSDRRPVGFALTGKAGPTGYLQRIAVMTSVRQRGIGRLLVDDAVRWLSRRGATTALVNTGVDNRAALELYARCGFHRLDRELLVMERR